MTLRSIGQQVTRFDGFPNPHLRTNAFMSKRTQLLDVRMGKVKQKIDTYEVESGHNSITAQIRGHGLRALVVDRNGTSYDENEWPTSRTYRQGSQENLLISDNQTRDYEHAGPVHRRYLSVLAWGPKADPDLCSDVP